MKTKELGEFYRILSSLNNGFTHYSFVWNQFNIDYLELFQENPDTLTKAYFEGNPFKKKHNIRFGNLGAEHIKTNEILIQGIFLLIYTHFEGYLKDLLTFSKMVDGNIKSLENKLNNTEDDDVLIEKVFNRVGIQKNKLTTEISVSLDYIRLKRNRLIHKNAENISNSLNDLIKKKGLVLNQFWNANLPGKLQGIDFVNKDNANTLSFNVVIDSINILRKASLEIDNLVTEKLTYDKITEKIIIPQFKKIQRKKINNIKIERLVSKFINFCDSEFALKVNDNRIELLKSSIA